MTQNQKAQLPRRERELLAGLRQWASGRGRGKGQKTRIPIATVRELFRSLQDRNPEDVFEPIVLDGLLKALESHGLIRCFQERTPDKVSLPVQIWLHSEQTPPPVRQPMPALRR